MSAPRVKSVEHVPRTRAQRTPQPTVTEIMQRPADPTPYYGRTLPDEGIGRIPVIGIDPGSPRWATPGANLK